MNPCPAMPRGRFALATVFILLLVGAALIQAEGPNAAAKLELKPGDHICIIGNTLAERMQHDGWLETMLYSRFPNHDLVIRNLGFSGDELNLRLRSQSFGTPDQWLAGEAPVPEPNRLVTRKGVRDNRFETTNTKADVIFAFFGYNESWAGAAGLPKFKQELADFIKHTLGQRYNGKSAPRLVLFSPTAFEDHRSPDLPDGRDVNERLELYTQAMAETARAHGVPFVDLFHPSKSMFDSARDSATGGLFTINGVHLNEAGNRLAALEIVASLFGVPAKAPLPEAERQALRAAVQDKNFHWFNRYRVMDGYNVYGGRAFEKYTDQQSNYEDQQRELEILDVKTANREKACWAIAKGQKHEVDDANCPPLIPVKTNKPGKGPNGANVFLSGEEAISKMTVAKGLKVSLFASEQEFPELAKPVQMQFDPQGRLWVAVWPSYPHWKPTEEMNDKILIFEDTNGDGKADRVTTFADHLNCPTGFEFWNGGVLVAQAPDLVFLKDTNGDGKADLRQRVLHGLDSADSHHTSNSFAFDPGGALYFQEGTFHRTQAESPYGPPRRCADAGVFRYEPRTQRFDVYVTHPFANPHGHVWDRWGQDIVYDGTGAQPYHGALFSGHLDFPQKHPHPPQVYQQRTRPCPGAEILSSRHFPEECQGNLLVANVIGFQGILQYKVHDQGASFGATEVEPILSSTDPNFRPSDLKIGPDGALWFIDWHNPIIGHLQHAIRDPNRDRTHGRIYRVTYEGRKPSPPVKIAGAPIEKLLDVLKEPEDRVRSRARSELAARDSDQVVAAADRWVAALDPTDPNHEHHLLEALWLRQAHHRLDQTLLAALLKAKDFRARAAATRVLANCRDQVPEALALLRTQAADPHPRVRLEALRAASFLTTPEAVEIVLIADGKPSDIYLDYVRKETLRALEPLVRQALATGRQIAFKDPAAAERFPRMAATEELAKLPRGKAVCLELLTRAGVREELRREAALSLAKLEGKSPARTLLDAIRSLDGGKASSESSLFDLARLLTAGDPLELREVRADLERLCLEGKTPVARQLGYVALVAADRGVGPAWELASRSPSRLRDLVTAMPLIANPGERANLFPKVWPLLQGLPAELAKHAEATKPPLARTVRIELPGKGRTLTLAEVEVYSGGKNVARQGRATQKSTAHGGDARRAIDGNTAGAFRAGGQTHTQENASDPWWQLELDRAYPIDSIVVFNRTEGELGKRLQGFTLKLLDDHQQVVFERTNQPAPDEKASFDVLEDSPARMLRRAAMLALVSVRGQETETFKALAAIARGEADRDAALAALLRIPAAAWPKEEAAPLAAALLSQLRQLPPAERTTPAALDAQQLAEGLAALLPPSEAKALRKELGDLGVRRLRLGTLLERMSYDQERLVVRAGRPVELLFENTDMMPHNFVLALPGALEKIGLLGEAAATQPGAAERQYVPQSGKILVASRLLQPREAQTLRFAAPAQPGVYPYVCTYPGHWRRMFGALYVVADLEEYQMDPEGYVAKNSLLPTDALLKLNRPRTEWKFEELAAAVEEMERDRGRSFAQGKQLFQVANCVACHKLDGAGHEFGPDLAKLDPKLKPTDILRDILEPSHKINDKYFTYSFELHNGKLVSGIILEETPTAVKLIENPLAKAEPLTLKTADIAERKKSPTSMMPKGLLDKLTKEEILDLVAYLAARGDPQHPLFRGGHAQGHGQGHGQ